MKKERKEEVLIHEIIHGILSHLEFAEVDNEHLVQCLANGIYQVFIKELGFSLKEGNTWNTQEQ